MANKSGNPDFARIRNTDTSAANVKRKAEADAYARKIAMVIVEWETEGYSSHDMAKRLNEEGHKTRLGGRWTATGVNRMLGRLGT